VKCICGFTLSAEQAAQNSKTCLSCGRDLQVDAIELLSDPKLGFVKEIRPGQIQYAETLTTMLNEMGHRVAMLEGGCGVGKSFGYLLPAILRGGAHRIIVATGKKSLQDQLANKDLPYLQRMLGKPNSFVALKGKSNYICQHLLKRNLDMFKEKGLLALHKKLTAWAAQDEVGDLDSFPGSTTWPVPLCTAEDCTDCSMGRDRTCGYKVLRAKAKEAELIIVNHSLLGFDLRLTPGKIFGAYDTLIVDEAHAAPGFIRSAFSQDLSPSWMSYTLNRLGKAALNFVPQQYFATEYDEACEIWEAMFANLPDGPILPTGFLGEAGKEAILACHKLEKDLIRLILFSFQHGNVINNSTSAAVEEVLKTGKDANGEKDLGELYEDILMELLSRRDDTGDSTDIDNFFVLSRMREQAQKKAKTIESTYTEDDNWINSKEETASGKVKILRQPVVLAPLISGPLRTIDKVLFTSATLNTDALKAELGVIPNYELIVPSPFPYKRSLIYLPKHLPRPDTVGWHDAVAEEVVKLVRASRGNALVLFSSMNDLNTVHDCIRAQYDLEYPLLCQGNGRRPAEVFDEYMRTDRAVLFGSKSFFEGIDVQGEKLSLVIIPKIPFPPREDPLNLAKERVLGKRNFWSKWYFPNMLQDIQQAAGRLVRTANDRGVIAILDVRMWVGGKKDLDPKTVGTSRVPWEGYGHRIIEALPFPNVSPRFELVAQVFEHIHQQNETIAASRSAGRVDDTE
jgi:ATP-dependent DNA helicase DinG